MRRSLVLLAAFALSCAADSLPPEGQIRIWIETDAPLPAGRPVPLDGPRSLFDRLRIDLAHPDGSPCSDCTREIALDRSMWERDAAFFTVLPPVGEEGNRARLRLFRKASQVSAEPNPDATIDVTVSLPAITAEGIVDVTVAFPTEWVGTRHGEDSPLPAERRRGSAAGVGSWPGAMWRECTTPPADDQVCIPGGAFFMGNPWEDPHGISPVESNWLLAADRQRLVSLSPFYMDSTEVTVRAFRPFSEGVCPELLGPGQCSVLSPPGEHEDYPVTYVSHAEARAYCQWRGGDLPTEAQYEYVASSLDGSFYPWGNDEPSCADAVFARYPNSACAVQGYYDPARTDESQYEMAVRPDRTDRDQVTLESGTVYDLAGNVLEWGRDALARQDDPCWDAHLLVDPVCEESGIGLADQHRTLGGCFFSGDSSVIRAAIRHGYDSTGFWFLGFRCVRAGQ